MIFSKKSLSSKLLISILLLLAIAAFSACSSPSTETEPNTESGEMEAMEHEEGDEHTEAEHQEEHKEEERIPNEGASIVIISPDSGSAFGTGEEVTVEVEVQQFALGEDGNHWHIYVDGTSWGMVVGGRTTETLRGLDPGAHQIEVYLTDGSHAELQDGDSIDITLE